MLSGAYSKQFRNVESHHINHLKQLAANEKIDSLARAKKLTQETNKRRRAQAVKRKHEAAKEEKRRKHILEKRREEQREATEKYQRSHVAHSNSRPSSHNSAKNSARALDHALRLVQECGYSRQNSYSSAGSPDPLNRPYFNKYSNVHKPPAGKVEGGKNAENQDKLHNNSLRNLTNSKSLFEHHLEQQQQLLLEHQQHTLQEFNNALKQDTAEELRLQGLENVEHEGGDPLSASETLSSCDSLEEDSSQTLEEESSPFIENKGHKGVSANNRIVNGSTNVVQALKQNGLPQNNKTFSNGGQTNYAQNQRNNFIQPQDNGRTYVSVRNATEDQGIIDSYGMSYYSKDQPKEEERPKVQLRAWASPSPVDQVSLQNSGATRNNPFSVRSTLTSVTTTTAYSKGGTQIENNYVQSNTWSEESRNLQQQYASNGGHHPQPPVSQYNSVQSANPQINGQTKASVPKPSQNVTPQQQESVNNKQTNLNFLESVTNNTDSDVGNAKPGPASRLPRPVSGKPAVNNNTNNGVKYTEHQSKQVQPIIGSPSRTREEAPAPTPSVSAPRKMAVLPDHPAIQVRHVTMPQRGEARKVIERKSKDDSEVMKNTAAKMESDHTGVRSILKRPTMAGGILKKAGSTGSMNNKFEVRDSIEITRVHMQEDKSVTQLPKKKSVRFAEHPYFEEFSDEVEHNEFERSYKGVYSDQLPTRPVSARSAQTRDQSYKPQRSASAGTHKTWTNPHTGRHRSTLKPQAAAHIITHSPAASALIANGADYSNSHDKKTVHNNFMSKVPATKNGYSNPPIDMTQMGVYSVPISSRVAYPAMGNQSSSQHYIATSPQQNGQPTEAVYDENGIRLDRTPTDDEINYLWDKVRTCLNRNPGSGSVTIVESPKGVPSTAQIYDQQQPKPSVTLSHKYIDGAALGSLNNTRVNQTQVTNPPYQKKNSDQGSYSKRYGQSLLHQRKQSNPNNINKGQLSQREFITYHGPVISNAEPQQGVVGPAQVDTATESLAAFQVAEQMTQQSVSDSKINLAMEEAQRRQLATNSSKPAQKVPSALSIEETRLLESLDRLNDRLKISEHRGIIPPSPPSQPAPPQQQREFVYESAVTPDNYTGGFKGSKPLQNQRNTTRVTSATMRTNGRFH